MNLAASRLVIEYVMEGHQRGYNFTSPTDGYDPDTLKLIWRSAMSRGQGWGAAAFSGARSIKCFPLDDGRVAVSEITVTGQQDENGRRGIRRAVVDVMTPAVFGHHIRSRLDGYPSDVRRAADRHRQQVQKGLLRLRRDAPLVLAHPFTRPRDWWAVEALVLRLIVAPPPLMRGWGAVVPFTTLALDYRGESRLVAVPADRIDAANDKGVVHLR